MRITAISTDQAGWKLIYAEKLVDQPKTRPFVSYGQFFDYKDGQLNTYEARCKVTIALRTYKEALSFIKAL